MNRVRAVWALVVAVVVAVPSAAQNPTPPPGVVVDQTGLPLPGVVLQLRKGDAVVATTTSQLDGTYSFTADATGTTVTASLDGFETTTVPIAGAQRIVLPLARATESTTVVAPAFVDASPSAPTLGAHLTAETVARMPSARLKAKDSLPLLPSVVRGADGLLRVGGARPYETPLLVDGFNVTDPATGVSNINLPFEAVRGVEALRDPMAVSYGGLLGGLMQIDSKPGGDQFKIGFQSFIPRPRLTSPGFGRLEGIFPRVYANGSMAQGRIRYFTTVEYDYERIPVPDVTEGTGPDIVEESMTMFGRADVQLSARQTVTFEALAFPATTRASGLSPRRDEAATVDTHAADTFVGVTDRVVFGTASVLTVRAGALTHTASLVPKGVGASVLSAAGWRGNWFEAFNRRATRYSATLALDRTRTTTRGTHTMSIGGGLTVRRLQGTVEDRSIAVHDDAEQIVRSIDFGPKTAFGARDARVELWLRDVWRLNDQLEFDGGARVDENTTIATAAPSGRVGVRWALGRAGTTVLKGGVGTFVGTLPLAVEAFGGYPARTDRTFDADDGTLSREVVLQPAVGDLELPRAVAATVQLERRLAPTVDGSIGVTARRSSRLAMLHVPVDGGAMPVRSTGASNYQELQLSMRKTWSDDQQLFVGYVLASSRGELNDFVALFQTLGAPLLRPGGMARTSSDARHRVIAWGTVNLPKKSAVSPVVELRSGFPYSAFNQRYGYFDQPNGRQFPTFMALDVVAYKTFTVKKRSADIGVQLFNVTNHFNPRDVYAVAGARRYGQFINSVGPILRGFFLIKY